MWALNIAAFFVPTLLLFGTLFIPALVSLKGIKGIYPKIKIRNRSTNKIITIFTYMFILTVLTSLWWWSGYKITCLIGKNVESQTMWGFGIIPIMISYIFWILRGVSEILLFLSEKKELK